MRHSLACGRWRRERIGGRIKSLSDECDYRLGDLGPSWVWPPFQPVLTRWLERLRIATSPQFEHGLGCIERTSGTPCTYATLPVQEGQRRPLGGPQAIVDALRARLPDGVVSLQQRVTGIACHARGVDVSIEGGAGVTADAIVLALPLRVAMRDVAFAPALPEDVAEACERTPTWMAAQAKLLAVYETPFWRAQGLSGRLSSALGPLVETHDHCGADAHRSAALVGFIGMDVAARHRLGKARLNDAAIAQLKRCFGASAARPIALHIEDWADASHIATASDRHGPSAHPSVRPDVLRGPVNERLRFAVAETADRSPGLLEGAIVAGESTAQALIASRERCDA